MNTILEAQIAEARIEHASLQRQMKPLQAASTRVWERLQTLQQAYLGHGHVP